MKPTRGREHLDAIHAIDRMRKARRVDSVEGTHGHGAPCLPMCEQSGSTNLYGGKDLTMPRSEVTSTHNVGPGCSASAHPSSQSGGHNGPGC